MNLLIILSFQNGSWRNSLSNLLFAIIYFIISLLLLLSLKIYSESIRSNNFLNESIYLLKISNYLILPQFIAISNYTLLIINSIRKSDNKFGWILIRNNLFILSAFIFFHFFIFQKYFRFCNA